MIIALILIAWILLNALFVCRRWMAAETRGIKNYVDSIGKDEDGEHDSTGIID